MRARTKSSKKSLKEVNIYPFDSKTIFTLQAEEAFDAKAIFWDSEKFIVVTLFAFYLDDLSSDPTDVQSNLLYSCNYNKIMRKSQVYIIDYLPYENQLFLLHSRRRNAGHRIHSVRIPIATTHKPPET